VLRKKVLLWVGVAILTQSAIASAVVNFKPEQDYPVGTNPAAVAVGDFNHDGKRDLAVINSGDPTTGDDGSVSILFGKGDGTFQAAKNVAIGKNCTSIVVGDFNGDGNDDLALVRPGDATVNDDGDVTIFLGNGDGTFHQGQVLTPGKNPSNKRGPIIAIDLNRDQRLDLVVANAGDNTFSVVLGNGDGTFQSPIAYPVANPPASILAVDLAGNGEKDLAVFRLIGVDFWLGNGDGTFRQGPSAGGVGVSARDFNGDNKDDLLVTPFVICFHNCNAVYPLLHLGNGDGTFQTGINVGQPVQAEGDFDGDGKLDLVGLVSNGSVQSQVLLGNGDGTFQQPVSFPVNSNESLSQALDVNADGAPDVVLIGQNSIGLMVNVGTDFSISASKPSPGTLSPGQSATSSISLSLLSAFHNPVSLACSVQPAQAGAPTCSLSSSSVSFDASGNASATLTISGGSSTASLGSFPRGEKWSQAGFLWMPVASFAFLGTGFGVGFSRKRKALMLLLGLVFISGVITLVACGGGSNNGPKSTTYTITVTGSSGAARHSTTVTLTAQ
jgi:hypothetical protein